MFPQLKRKSRTPARETPPPPLVSVNNDNASTFREAADFDAQRTAMYEASEHRAWSMVRLLAVIAVLAVLSAVLVAYLKEDAQPMIVRVNQTTGQVEVITVLKDTRITYEDAMDKYWLAKFVRARETYDWYTVQDDYDRTRALSHPFVFKPYAALFSGENALDKKLGQSIRVTVDVISVQPNGSGTALVRFNKATARIDSPDHKTVATYIATVAYEYANPSKLNVNDRQQNPIGFQVVSYRADEEFAVRNTPVYVPADEGEQP